LFRKLFAAELGDINNFSFALAVNVNNSHTAAGNSAVIVRAEERAHALHKFKPIWIGASAAKTCETAPFIELRGSGRTLASDVQLNAQPFLAHCNECDFSRPSAILGCLPAPTNHRRSRRCYSPALALRA
jgi:hypothetical protein